jgi:hypothetical protein
VVVFVIIFVILFVTHYIITVIIVIDVLTELILNIRFGALVGCWYREEDSHDLLIVIVLDVTGLVIVASTIYF